MPAVMEPTRAAVTFVMPELVRPAAAEGEGAKWSDWFAVLRAGTFERYGEEMVIEQGDLDNAIAQFHRFRDQGLDVTVDYDHMVGEAAGWYRDLRRDGDLLMARVEWTDQARDQIASKRYRYFSAEFHPAWKDQHGEKCGFTVLAGALTNRPFLKDLGPVALSDDVQAALDQDQPLTRAEVERIVSERLAAAPVVTTTTNTANTDGWVVVKASETQGAMSKTPETTVTLSESEVTDLRAQASRVEELENELATLKGTADKAEALAQAVADLKDTVTALSERADAAEKELFTERFNALLNTARNEGRIDAKDETTQKWSERAQTLGLDGVAALLSEFPAQTIPTEPVGHGKDKPLSASDAPEGVDPEAHAFHEKVEQYRKDNPNVSYADAAIAVEMAGGA